MRGIEGKVAIVTGGGQGIGRAIVERFLGEGASVLAVDKQSENLAQLPRSERLHCLEADVTGADAPRRIVEACTEAFGAIHILVNNAGLGNAPPVHETTDEIFDLQISVNLRSAFRVSREALAELRATRGAIVNMASVNALAGYRRQAAYSAAKAGLIGMTRNMAVEYGPEGLRVNAVAPGLVATAASTSRLATKRFRVNHLGTTPLGSIVYPDEIAAAVVFLSSSDARSITGQVLVVDGGQTSSVYLNDDVIRHWEQSDEAGGAWDQFR